MLTLRVATHAEPLRRESRSEEDKMIMWEIVVPLVHLDYVTSDLRLSLLSNTFSESFS